MDRRLRAKARPPTPPPPPSSVPDQPPPATTGDRAADTETEAEAGAELEDDVTPPDPHEIQAEALAALAATRADGNEAGLVVLATGLGKTWLSAFDSCRRAAEGGRLFRRVLFVAHREEILEQAFRTFRRIHPTAHLGYYTGDTKDGDADVLFASIQTLGKQKATACLW